MSRIISSHSHSFNTLEESRLLTRMNNNAYECTNNNFNYLYEYKTFQEQNITFLCCFILPAHLGESTFHILLQTFELSCNFICFIFFFFLLSYELIIRDKKYKNSIVFVKANKQSILAFAY